MMKNLGKKGKIQQNQLYSKYTRTVNGQKAFSIQLGYQTRKTTCNRMRR
jgi:hypothetical protein